MGYWMEAYSSVGSNARYNQSGWNCGDTHEISYKDGKNHASDKEEIVVEYNYMWNPLKVYKTYNTPNEPTAPEDPGEARDLVDVPELYDPKYETYEEKQHVAAELEEIGEADLWDYVPGPVKKAYMSLMDHMSLFDVPEAAETTEPAAPAAEPEAPAATPEAAAVPAKSEVDMRVVTKKEAKVTLVAKKAAPSAASAAIANNTVPQSAASTYEVSENEVPMIVAENDVPQASAGAWALINLLSALATALLSLIMMVRYFRGRREDEETDRDRKGIRRLASLIPAIGAIAAFIFTENMANPMILTDRWTAMMIIILAVQAGWALLVEKKANNDEEALSNA